jgi:hypothetical protein
MSNFKFGKVKPNLKLDKLPYTGKVTYTSPWLTGKVATADLNIPKEYTKEQITIAKDFWAKR